MSENKNKINVGSNEVLLTAEGIRRKEEELEELKTVKRQEIAERIKVAIAFGDISENSEYDDAKNEQAFNEGKIIELENMLRVARVIDEDEINTHTVNVGNTVRLWDEEFEEELCYTIVGRAEANPAEGKISYESPMGAALLGANVDQIVEVNAPAGVIRYKVIGIDQ